MRRLLLTFSLLVVVGCGRGEPAATSTSEATVEMSIEFDGVRDDRSFDVQTESGATVFTAMQIARDRELMTFETDDSSGMPFVTAIDGVKGEGAADGARNWQYWVNGDYATQGVGQATLEDGDRVQWKYKNFDGGFADDES